MKLDQWAIKNHVSVEALAELRDILGMRIVVTSNTYDDNADERNVQNDVRLEGARVGVKLWRNNVGVLMDKRGVPVRYGLANDSANLNSVMKSADLVGWRRVLITKEMVGWCIAQFVSRECKHPNWKWSGSDREIAQLAWANMVLADGGDASFCATVGTLS